MSWKKILETEEVISYLRETATGKRCIEARQEANHWKVFEIAMKGEQTHVLKEIKAKSKQEAKSIIGQIINKKALPLQMERVTMHRAIKDMEAEKWLLRSNNQDLGFFLIHFGMDVNLDVVLHASVAHQEQEIVADIFRTLGLEKEASLVSVRVYYFSQDRQLQRGMQTPMVMGSIEMRFGDE
ncbi:hypothetical protein HZB02_06970 [Candidatus Woesearchaeota archaeon]|nr:hypothetical protein [Candidatus Woesearchaeota archaeon]